ncbi:MAG: hypothetical protein Ta2G_22090 [Termitinemataceae bacterium]|nr:MAG: hypothetical protein Ta2G_22090 [Termitinemataceae bacterium]
MIDLHTHSTASDGSFSPSALMQLAKAKGLHAIALTDHDTIDGIEEAAYEANKLGIQFIPGTEIEIDWEEPNSEESFDENSEATGKKREFHLLGLGIHSPSANFLLMLQDLKEKRERRNLSIIEKMRDLGMDADYNEIAVIAGTDCIEQGIIGLPHFAKYLVQQKKSKNIQQAFDKYLGKGKVLYMQKRKCAIKNSTCLYQRIRGQNGFSASFHVVRFLGKAAFYPHRSKITGLGRLGGISPAFDKKLSRKNGNTG